MTREEAIKIVKENMHLSYDDGNTFEALKTLVPEFREESEDEKLRKYIIKCCEECIETNDKGLELSMSTTKRLVAYLEKQKEQKQIKLQVYEVGKGTTICGQDYKCKKDYKAGNCWYIKDVIYHCGRDGFLTDQNGISWSCTPEWFKEYIYSNAEWAEKEKSEFVGGQFIQCNCTLDNGLKKGEHYWLEYVGDDTYVGRSDNILNQKFHITPRQLFTLFIQQLEEKQKEQNLELYYDKELDSAAREFYFSGGADSLVDSTGLVPIVKMAEFGATWMKKKMEKEQKPVEKISKEEHVKKFKALCDAYEIKLPNREYDIYHLCDDLSKLSMDSGKQKPAEWSEEDEDKLYRIIETLLGDKEAARQENPKHYDVLCQAYDELISWLKFFSANLKKRNEDVAKLCSNEWSKEDKKILNELLDYCNTANATWYNWLKSLRPQAKQEWSEEDEDMRNNIIRVLSVFVGTVECESNPSLSSSYPIYLREISWLKSLLERFNLQPKQERSEEDKN